MKGKTAGGAVHDKNSRSADTSRRTKGTVYGEEDEDGQNKRYRQ